MILVPLVTELFLQTESYNGELHTKHELLRFKVAVGNPKPWLLFPALLPTSGVLPLNHCRNPLIHVGAELINQCYNSLVPLWYKSNKKNFCPFFLTGEYCPQDPHVIYLMVFRFCLFSVCLFLNIDINKNSYANTKKH